MRLLLKISRSLVTLPQRTIVTIPTIIKPHPIDPCLYCNGRGKCKCMNCNGRGILIEDCKEYRCSSCNRTGWKTCSFCAGDGKSYRIF